MRKLYGVKSTLPFSKLIIGKSQVFQHARSCICTVIRKYMTGGHNVPPPGPNRVKTKKTQRFESTGFYTLHIKLSWQWRQRFCLSVLWNYNMPTRRAHSFVLNFGNVHQLRPCVWGTSREQGSWHNLYFWSCPCHPKLVCILICIFCVVWENTRAGLLFLYTSTSMCVCEVRLENTRALATFVLAMTL